jgi:hypothetical protein
MAASTAADRAGRGVLRMLLDVFTASRVGMVRVRSEAPYLDSFSGITYCRLSVGHLTAFPHLEEQHADARERSRDYHTGKCQGRNPTVNNQAHGKRRSKHLQKTENQPDKRPSANVSRTGGFATGSVESNSGIRQNRHC